MTIEGKSLKIILKKALDLELQEIETELRTIECK
jgi:hypothetical protein